jgi:hypothetical protein
MAAFVQGISMLKFGFISLALFAIVEFFQFKEEIKWTP